MNYVFALTFFILGAIWGSFLNVLILRHNTGKSPTGRSGCMSCRSTLRFYDLVPILSFLALRGRCRSCGSKISIQYPLVEFVTGTVFALAFYKFGISLKLVLVFIILSLLIVLAVYDFKHFILPDFYMFSLILFAVIYSAVSGVSIVNIILHGFLTAVPFFLIWFFSKGKWMGFGDVKLALAIGILLGLPNSLVAVALASVLGAFFGVAYVLYHTMCITGFAFSSKKVSIKSEIPFGPFLIVATVLVWFFNLGEIYLRFIGL